jgi:cyanate permease
VKKWREFIRFSLEIAKPHENKMYLLSMGLLKSILYGFLLWMPTYLTHQGYKDYSTYAPSIFNVATVFGSALLGYFYKDRRRVPRSEY